MEGGRKIDIDLDRTGIDVKSSDMLVPLNIPKFAHNRQRWQGHVLPTSLRYERNGWAAGWYVYDFSFRDGYIYDATDTLALDRIRLNNNPTYICRLHRKVDDKVQSTVLATFMQNTKTSFVTSDVLDFTVTYNAGSLNTVHTCKFNSKQVGFSIIAPTYINGNDGYGISNVSGTDITVGIDSTRSTLESDGMIAVKVTDSAAHLSFDGTMTLPADVKSICRIGGVTYTYDFAGFEGLSDGILSYMSTSNSTKETYGQNVLTVNGVSAAFVNNADGVRTYTVSVGYSVEYSIKFNTRKVIPYIYHIGAGDGAFRLATSANTDLSVNVAAVYGVNNLMFCQHSDPTPQSPDTVYTFQVEMPVWLSYTCDFNGVESLSVADKSTFSVLNGPELPGDDIKGRRSKHALCGFVATVNTSILMSGNDLKLSDRSFDALINVYLCTDTNGTEAAAKETVRYNWYRLAMPTECYYERYGLNKAWSASRIINAGSALKISPQYRPTSGTENNVKQCIWLYSNDNRWLNIVPKGYTGEGDFIIPLDFVIEQENLSIDNDTFLLFDILSLDQNTPINMPNNGRYYRRRVTSTDDYGPRIMRNGVAYWPSTIQILSGVQHYFVEQDYGAPNETGTDITGSICQPSLRFQKPVSFDNERLTYDDEGNVTSSVTVGVYDKYKVRLDSVEGWSGIYRARLWRTAGATKLSDIGYEYDFSYYGKYLVDDVRILHGQSLSPQILYRDGVASIAFDARFRREFKLSFVRPTNMKDFQADGFGVSSLQISENTSFGYDGDALQDYMTPSVPSHAVYEDYAEYARFSVRVSDVTLDVNNSTGTDRQLAVTDSGTVQLMLNIVPNGDNMYINYTASGSSDAIIPDFGGSKNSTSKSTLYEASVDVDSMSNEDRINIQLTGEYSAVVGIVSASVALLTDSYNVDHYFFDVMLPEYLQKSRTDTYNMFTDADGNKLSGELFMPGWRLSGGSLITSVENAYFKLKTFDGTGASGAYILDLKFNGIGGKPSVGLQISGAAYTVDEITIDELYDSTLGLYAADGSTGTVAGSNHYVNWFEGSGVILRRTWSIPYTLTTVQPVPPAGWTLHDITEGTMSLTKGNYTVRYTIANGGTVLNYQNSGINYTYSITDKTLNVTTGRKSVAELKFDQDIYGIVRIAPKGVFAFSSTYGYTLAGLSSPFSTVIARNGTQYTFDLTGFESVERYLDISSADVRDPDVENTKLIQTITCSREKQLLRQFWDTNVSTENFWWVSDSYVLKLTDDHLILYKKKANEYDDWQADIWEEERRLPRTDYLPSSVRRYFCTNAFGEHSLAYARFCTIEPRDNDTFRIRFYDPIKELIEGKMQYLQYDVDIIKREIGQKLNPYSGYASGNNPKLYSYTRIQMPVFLSEVKISATCCDGYIALGLHYDNNFNQWTLLVDADVTTTLQQWRVIQGYGYVGVDGHLTGGQIPSYCFDAMNGGFTGTVEDISVLSGSDTELTSLADLDSFTSRIVGNENQQWYITRGMTGIVSHIRMLSLDNAGNPDVQVLPITNNYASVYESPSFVIRKSGDIGIGAKSLQNLFPSDDSTFQTIWTVILVAVGYPLIYYINPKISTINYLQQTLGQYAYVHYNSTAIRRQLDLTEKNDEIEDLSETSEKMRLSPIDLDELSFDVFHIPQEQDVGANPWQTLLYAIGAAGLNALEYGIEKLQVNTHIGQQTTADKGMQFSQMFQKNIESMSSAEFTVQSVTPVNKSEVTAVKTLDMFYSTSAGQHVEAGPGFVVHNFVAQCVAQSVTSVQLESQQVTMMYVIKALTMFQLNLEYKALKIAADLIKSNAEGEGGTPFTVGGFATGTSYGWIATLILNAVYATLQLAMLGIATAIENIDPLLDALGASQFKSSITAKQSKHTYDVEAKHKYGSKHETFMWPCYNCTLKTYKDEYVLADTQNKPWSISISPYADGVLHTNIGEDMVLTRPATSTIEVPDDIKDSCVGDIDYRIASCRGESKQRTLPDDMAVIIGAESFMPSENFKNVNISESEPVFTTPVIQDFVISKQYELSMTCTAGEIAWVSCRDTKLIDGAPSNIVYSKGFCGVASTYTAIEVRNSIEPDYLRPWAVTPDILAINMTGLNVMYDEQAYHGFDGVGYRITDWLGAPGMNKEHYTLQYAFQINDRLKRSNKLPPNQFLGNFTYDPSYATDVHDPVCSIVTIPGENTGLEAGTIGEDKDVQRYSLPIFSEFVSTLPAVVKTAQPYKLAVVDGITSLTTDLRNTQVAYKTPVSNDFILGQQLYRATQEYICSVVERDGAVIVTPLVPTLGMHYIGATPFEAFFYSQATRQYYSYSGGSDIRLVSMLERFRDIVSGRWDFVNQNVIMPCLATFDRLDAEVKDDDDETDNIIVLALADGDVRREVAPPVKTIFKAHPKDAADRSYNADASCDMGFRVLSLPSGLTYQGPNRCIINRYTWSEYMLAQIKANKGKWKKVPREVYHPFREYYQNFESVNQFLDAGVKGWTHNPFLLVTAPLGINEETDCMFEWEITFAWTVEMDKLYEDDEYVCVNICAETMAPGGKIVERPTHIYLTKDLFTRTGKYGYYSFRHQGNGGAGNRERLHIWSDGYIAVSSVQVEYKVITQKRSEMLTQQVDIQALKEF